MKVTIELDIPLQEIARTIGVKSKSYVHKMLKSGKGEQVGELLVNAWRTQGEQHQNVRVVKINILDPKKVNDWRTEGERRGELLVNAKEQETKETLSPEPPIKENKEKEKGGLTPTLSSENIKFSFGESPPFGNDKNFVKETEKDKKPETQKTERKIFIPPTVEEVQAYINIKGYDIDAEQFCAFYESKGWMVGSNKMKNWQMALMTWRRRTEAERKQNSYSYGTSNNRTNPWSNRRTAPVIASSAKDYEGRF